MNASLFLNDYKHWQILKRFKTRGIEERYRQAESFFQYLNTHQMSVAEIGYKEASSYRDFLVGQVGEKGSTYTASTVNTRISNTKTLYSFLMSQGEAINNPFAEVERMREPDRLPRHILSLEQMELLLSSLPCKTFNELKVKTAIEILYATGMRINELETLKREDIDLVRAIVWIRDDKERQDRLCALTECANRMIALYLEEEKSNEPFRCGQLRSLNAFVNYRLKTICTQLELPIISAHCIRHSIATHLLKKGADIREVQEFLGHRRIKNTEIYTRLATDYLKKIIDTHHPRERKPE